MGAILCSRMLRIRNVCQPCQNSKAHFINCYRRTEREPGEQCGPDAICCCIFGHKYVWPVPPPLPPKWLHIQFPPAWQRNDTLGRPLWPQNVLASAHPHFSHFIKLITFSTTIGGREGAWRGAEVARRHKVVFTYISCPVLLLWHYNHARNLSQRLKKSWYLPQGEGGRGR